MEQFVEDFVERNRLVCGGGWNSKKKAGGFMMSPVVKTYFKKV